LRGQSPWNEAGLVSSNYSLLPVHRADILVGREAGWNQNQVRPQIISECCSWQKKPHTWP
jgi:hypothetical protein